MHLKIILSVLALFSIAFLVPSDAFGAWYDTEWEYRNKITVSLNSVISNDLSDFPVLIKFTHNDLKQANESEGRDFVFTLSDGTTKLSHEIEHYDNATGEIIAWVNFPTLVFESKVNQKVLGFYDESMLLDVVSDWTGSSQDVSDLAEILGIPDEQIPPWVTNLAVWVSEDKISMGDMIVSIEHLINN